MNALRCWKLFRVRKDGTLGSLFINRRAVIPVGEWLMAACHPKAGFKVRAGWHAAGEPVAPHLSQRGRVWREVLIRGWERLERPKSQGGLWYLGKEMMVIPEA